MFKPLRPRCICLNCHSYALIYSSLFDIHLCLECELTLQPSYVENIVEGFSLYKERSILLTTYNKIVCLSCNTSGGMSYRDKFSNSAFCNLCNYEFSIDNLHKVMVSKYETKLLEKSYNIQYSIKNDETFDKIKKI